MTSNPLDPFRYNDGTTFEGFLTDSKKLCETKKAQSIDPIKQKLGQATAYEIRPGDLVALGTGETSEAFIKCLAERCKNGLSITVVASSKESYDLARKLKINVLQVTKMDIRDEKFIDVYVGGAFEVDENFNMIKGRGGALLREKVLAMSSKKVIIMIDSSKQVKLLGTCPLPVEVAKFGCDLAKVALEECGCFSEKRKNEDGSDFVTDNGNYILDVKLPRLLDDPKKTHDSIKNFTGVVDTGIFVGLIDQLLVGFEDGNVKKIDVIDVEYPQTTNGISTLLKG